MNKNETSSRKPRAKSRKKTSKEEKTRAKQTSKTRIIKKVKSKQKTKEVVRPIEKQLAKASAKLPKKQRIKPSTAEEYKYALDKALKALEKLYDIADRSRSPRKAEMETLLKVIEQCFDTLSKHAPQDKIPVHDPEEVLKRIKAMNDEGLLSYTNGAMARVLLLSCVFESNKIINIRTLPEWLKNNTKNDQK